MSDTKWTPGPWAIYHDHPNPETAKDMATIRHVGALKHEDVTNVFLCDYPGKLGERARANAQLIAAAPDLYEALAHMAAMLCAACLAISGSETRRLALEAVEDARAILAKARGE